MFPHALTITPVNASRTPLNLSSRPHHHQPLSSLPLLFPRLSSRPEAKGRSGETRSVCTRSFDRATTNPCHLDRRPKAGAERPAVVCTRSFGPHHPQTLVISTEGAKRRSGETRICPLPVGSNLAVTPPNTHPPRTHTSGKTYGSSGEHRSSTRSPETSPQPPTRATEAGPQTTPRQRCTGDPNSSEKAHAHAGVSGNPSPTPPRQNTQSIQPGCDASSPRPAKSAPSPPKTKAKPASRDSAQHTAPKSRCPIGPPTPERRRVLVDSRP